MNLKKLIDEKKLNAKVKELLCKRINTEEEIATEMDITIPTFRKFIEHPELVNFITLKKIELWVKEQDS